MQYRYAASLHTEASVTDPHHADVDPELAFLFDVRNRIQILPFTLVGIRILPFNLMQIRILPLKFFPDLGPSMLQNGNLRLSPFYFDAGPDPAFHVDADPDPAYYQKGCGSETLTEALKISLKVMATCTVMKKKLPPFDPDK
jgi:hypothetical protein